MLFGLLAAKALTVLLGLVIALQGYRAARRERSQRMLLVASGFTLLSVGSVLEGICYDVFHLSTLLSGAIQTGFVGLGMSLIVVSLYAPGAGGRRTEPPEVQNRN
ncbi:MULTISPECIES: DUF7521 family protein [Haloarcula]|uniref:Uncharacterized protein n=1 Tax=Haloarcula pellucida TaxID=1427151 RepID=A0A830GKF8_9EURY|nr:MULTISPECIES: hypothetical protein [Halomicroarcula]MBX0349888.1 hypothetical protein [Halomicroarcula pellucida]MDS0279631.1 hypothetical protein [Halomicroarcula sp. S1AR25-4]GGN94832.1 hypothetical protein GCM10009030_21570 [Halomicroarcula pellucida]